VKRPKQSQTGIAALTSFARNNREGNKLTTNELKSEN